MAGDAALAGLLAYTVLHAVETLDVQACLSCSGGETCGRAGLIIPRVQNACGFDPTPGTLTPVVCAMVCCGRGWRVPQDRTPDHTKVTSDLLR